MAASEGYNAEKGGSASSQQPSGVILQSLTMLAVPVGTQAAKRRGNAEQGRKEECGKTLRGPPPIINHTAPKLAYPVSADAV